MFVRVGVDSNLLALDDGRLVFTQSDGSLTVLDLATGDVLLRRSDRSYSGTFVRVPPGILLVSYDWIALLDAGDLTTRWETRAASDPNLADGLLVSHDGNGRVEARALDSGALLWSHELPGALELDARNGRLLVHRTYAGPPTAELLDLATGRSVFSRTSGNVTAVGFDGRWLFVPTGGSGAGTDRVEIRDRDGDLRDTVDVPRTWAHPPARSYPTRAERDRVLLDAGVVPDGPSPYPAGYEPLRRAPDDAPFAGADGANLLTAVHAASVLSGALHVGSGGPAIRVGDRVVISSRSGFVECVDVAAAKSTWLYRFPALDHQMSGSFPLGMGPRLLERALKFRREWDHFAADLDGQTRLVADPQPYAPFPSLIRAMVLAALASTAPFGLALWLRRSPAVPDGLTSGLTLALATVPLGALGTWARVALATTVLLKVSIGALLIVSATSLRLRQLRSIWGVVTIVGWGVLLALTWPLLVWG